MINGNLVPAIERAIGSFGDWLDAHGEVSWDHQSFFASPVGRAAKSLYYRKPLLGTFAVAPMIFCEAFVPSARRLFWKPQRLPIADAHYAMGFALLARIYGKDQYYRRAVHFLEVLQETRCAKYDEYGWGYPFDWETRNGTLKEGTPLITTVPYAYEAFSAVYAIDADPKWRRILQSIARHAARDYRDLETGTNSASCGYTPSASDPCGVINASAYRAFLLTKASIELCEPRYLEIAQRNLNFVLDSQNADGSWFYATDGTRDFVDHFHTCFVLKAVAKIEQLTRCARTSEAIERGIDYYVTKLVDANGLPIPFSKRPRLTVYKRELYDYAECMNLGTLLLGRFEKLDAVLSATLADLFSRWQLPNGAFRARELLLGWDNVPMHRWAQSQMFRSLCFLLERIDKPQDNVANADPQLIGSKAAS
jgi:hypothetical protein